jgi:hypothetical protein
MVRDLPLNPIRTALLLVAAVPLLAQNPRGLESRSPGFPRLTAVRALGWETAGYAQAPAAEPAKPSKLNLVIVEGEGAINNIRQRVAREPIVQVEDENHRPIAGAAVTFALPKLGASGTFANGSQFVTVVTDASGRAAAGAFTPNGVAGAMKISVTASYQGQTATATVSQTNALAGAAAGGGAGLSTTTIGVIAGVAVAAGVGIIVGMRKPGPPPPPPPPPVGLQIGLNQGGITIGRP